MNNTVSFNGWQPSNTEQIVAWKENFDEIYNDAGQLALVSKDVFQSDTDGNLPCFKYRYVIKVEDEQGLGADQKVIDIRLLICPLKEYWNPDTLKIVVDDNDWLYEDAADTEVLPVIGLEQINYTDEDVPPDENGNKWYDYFYNVLDNPKVNELLDVISTVLQPMDSMRGNSLDQIWNQLGNTGWDLLEYILNGKDWVSAGIQRYKATIK